MLALALSRTEKVKKKKVPVSISTQRYGPSVSEPEATSRLTLQSLAKQRKLRNKCTSDPALKEFPVIKL